MRTHRRWTVCLLSALVVPAAAGVLGGGPCGVRRAGEASVEPVAVSANGASAGPMGKDHRRVARVVLTPNEEVTLSAEVSAKVLRAPLRLGDAFEEGDVLIELDDRTYVAAVQRAEAVAEAADLALEAARDLHSRQDASALELANARRDAMVARAAVAVARVNLENCRILAPFAGRVARTHVTAHELTREGRAVIELVDDSTLIARVLLPESCAPAVARGRELPFALEAGGRTVTGTIVRIAPQIDPASRTFEVHAEVDNRDRSLCSGMSGWLDLSSLATARPCSAGRKSEADHARR